MDQYLNNVAVVDCAAIHGGISVILERFPSCAAVYAWYRNIELPDPTLDADAFADGIVRACAVPHMPPLYAHLPPKMAVRVESCSVFSEAKIPALRKFCESPAFRLYLYRLLHDNQQLLQAPVYVGKALSLRDRVEDHLRGRGSELRARLNDAGINIERCRVAFALVSQSGVDLAETNMAALVVEEVLSRLFVPPFTLRYA